MSGMSGMGTTPCAITLSRGRAGANRTLRKEHLCIYWFDSQQRGLVMGIRIVSEKPLIQERASDPAFYTALDVSFKDACWTHTTLCAGALLRSLAELAKSDHHRVTVYLHGEVEIMWEGDLDYIASKPNSKEDYEAMCRQVEGWG